MLHFNIVLYKYNIEKTGGNMKIKHMFGKNMYNNSRSESENSTH